ncbi:hypothetical protein Tco_0281972 [Tanacetum coccineum]
MNKKAAETDTSKKRKSGSRAKRMSKRQKTDSDVEEKEKLKSFLNLKPDEDKAINYEVLQTRFPIVNWESKFYDYSHYGRELIYYRVIKADGSSRWIKTFSEMIKLFDRMDLGDLKTMFESNADDELWKNQEEWNLQSWVFHENCRVHVLRLEDGTEINMLAERRYPLTKDTLERMLDLRLTTISDDDTVLDLLRFIEKFQNHTTNGHQFTMFNRHKNWLVQGQTAPEGKLKENQGCRVDTGQVHQDGDFKNRSVWIHPLGLQDAYTEET